MDIFRALIWGGTALTLLGLGLLIWCILRAMRLRRAGLPDAEMRAAMQRIVTLNLGALAASTLGLMAVVMGVFLAS